MNSSFKVSLPLTGTINKNLLMDFMMGQSCSPLQIITKYPDDKIESGSELQLLKQKAMDIAEMQDACSIDELLSDEVFKKDIEEYIVLRELFITKKLEERLLLSKNIIISVAIKTINNNELREELDRSDVSYWL